MAETTTKPFWKKFNSFIQNLDWIITIILSIVIAILGVLDKVGVETLITTTLLVLGLLGFGALRDRASAGKINALLNDVKEKYEKSATNELLLSDRIITGLERVFTQTVHYDWLSEIEKAKNVTFVKIKLNFTHDPDYYSALERILQRGDSVTIVIADPRCPAMWLRYRDEPNPLWAPEEGIPQTAWIQGLEELSEDAYRLHQWKVRLLEAGQDVSRLSIKVFQHYPTHAFYRFDDRIFVYHYPFMERGFHAPAFLFSDKRTEAFRFYSRCIGSIVKNSVDLEIAMDDIWRQHEDGLLKDQEVKDAEISFKRRRNRKIGN